MKRTIQPFAKALAAILFISISCIALSIFLPWWTVSIPCFIAFIILSTRTFFIAFLIGFVSVFATWFLMSFFISALNEHVLSRKITAALFHLSSDYYGLLFALSGSIGGIVGGVSAVSGRLCKKYFLL